MRLNKIKNVLPLNLGVYSNRKKIKLYLDKTNTGGHSTIIKSDKYVYIDCITLQDIFKKFNIERRDFLKMDCEGAEYDILFNTPKNVLNKIYKISLEYHHTKSNHLVYRLKKYLEKNGFTVKIIKNMLYAKDKDLKY